MARLWALLWGAATGQTLVAWAEEIEGVAKRDKRELASRLKGLIMHLLTWCAQPQGRQLGHSWRDALHEQRSRIELVLDNSPSLYHEAPTLITNMQRIKSTARPAC
jgi:hypothetical protein